MEVLCFEEAAAIGAGACKFAPRARRRLCVDLRPGSGQPRTKQQQYNGFDSSFQRSHSGAESSQERANQGRIRGIFVVCCLCSVFSTKLETRRTPSNTIWHYGAFHSDSIRSDRESIINHHQDQDIVIKPTRWRGVASFVLS